MSRAVRKFSNTFWSNKRVENKLSIGDLADLLNASYTQASKYLTGQVVPNATMRRKICTLFDVPYDIGEQEFINAHNLWKQNNDSKYAVIRQDTPINTSATTDTFWHNLRKQKGVTLAQVGKELHIDASWLSRCFTGQALPPTKTAVAICDYFGIDYVVGATEFNKTHDAWIKAHPGKRDKSGNIRSRKFDTKNATETPIMDVTPAPTFSTDNSVSDINETPKCIIPELEEVATEVSEVPMPNTTGIKDIKEFLYHKISYDDFMLVMKETNSENILRVIYDIVDYDTFKILYDICKD